MSPLPRLDHFNPLTPEQTLKAVDFLIRVCLPFPSPSLLFPLN